MNEYGFSKVPDVGSSIEYLLTKVVNLGSNKWRSLKKKVLERRISMVKGELRELHCTGT